MSHKPITLIIVVVAAVGSWFLLFPKRSPPEERQPTGLLTTVTPSPTVQGAMDITSAAFQHTGAIPAKYTCDGENVHPPLRIADVPAEAKSLVLIVDDPDAPRGDWVHWTIWNIAPDTAEIPEGMVPVGVTEGTTDFGKQGYGGPCPPSGTHRYQFKLSALDVRLTLPPTTQKRDVERAMEEHILAQALLVGTYARTR